MKRKFQEFPLAPVIRNFSKIVSVYIFGCGINGEQVFHHIKEKCNIEGFIDNNPTKQNTYYLGKYVYSPADILGCFTIIVAGSEEHENQMIEQLENMGYKIDENLFRMNTFLKYFFYAKNNEIYIPQCNLSVTEKCSLNCENCSVLKPYIVSPQDEPLDKLKKDIDLFFQWVDYVGSFGIVGGEPFLYPYFSEIIQYIGAHYRKKIGLFNCVTNGTIEAHSTVLSILKRFDVTVTISDYSATLPSLKKKIERLQKLLQEWNICHSIFQAEHWIDFGYGKNYKANWTDEELESFFDTCKMPCRLLQDEHLYYCANSKFAINANLHDADQENCFDLNNFQNERKEKLFYFDAGYSSKGYLNFCRHCDGFLTINKNFVEVAKQKYRK